MKNLKKIFALVTVISILFTQFITVNASKSFSDVPTDNNSFSEAIYTLSDLGIIKGDAGADTFRPKANISREEFSVIVDRIMGMGDLNITVNDYVFSDVTPETCDDWSIKATKIAYDLKIVSGMGDGTFAPKANVTFEQAVKMIVCALGYNSEALSYGGWPNGYMTVARNKGITKKCEMGQTLPATREVIAQLVFNALDVDLMVANTNGDKIVYTVQEGQNILNQKLKYEYGTGTFIGTTSQSIEKVPGLSDGYVAIKDTKTSQVEKFAAESADYSSYLGKTVRYYYEINDKNEYQLVSVREHTASNSTKVDCKYIKNITSSEVEYYIDDNYSETNTLAFVSRPALTFNGQYTENETINSLKNDILNGNGTVEFVDNNNDDVIEIININIVSVFVIDAIDSTNYRIYDKYDQANILNLKESAKNEVNIYKNDSKIQFPALKIDDVLLVSESKNSNKVTNIRVITITKKGSLQGVASDRTELTVGSTDYKVSDVLRKRFENDSSLIPDIGSKVTVYLNDSDEVMEISSEGQSSNYSYGYIYSSGTNSKKDSIIVRLVGADGVALDLKVATKIKIDGTTYTCSDVKNDTDVVNQIVSLLARDQVVKYSINSNGQLNNVLTATTGQTDTTKYLVKYKDAISTDKYQASTKSLGREITLNASTKVMFVPTDISDTDEYSVKSYSAMKDEGTYSYFAYDCTETGVAKFLLVKGYTMSDSEAPAVVVNSVVSTSDGYKLTGYSGNSTVTYYTDDADNDCIADYKRGDVLRLKLNSSDKISSVTLMFSPRDIPELKATEAEMSSNAQNNSDNEIDFRYYTKGTNYDTPNAEYMSIFGTSFARDTDRTTVSLFDVEETIDADGNPVYSLNNDNLIPVAFNESTAFFTVDTTINSTSSNYLTKASYSNIAGFKSAKSGASQMYAYCSEGVAKIIIVLIK